MEYRVLGKTGLKISRLGFGGIPIQRIDAEGTKVLMHQMKDAGINDGDLVVIDKSLEAQDGDYVAAFIDGEFTLKQFKLDEANHCAWLIPANENYSPIKVTEDNDFMVWGVITSCIKRFHKF